MRFSTLPYKSIFEGFSTRTILKTEVPLILEILIHLLCLLLLKDQFVMGRNCLCTFPSTLNAPSVIASLLVMSGVLMSPTSSGHLCYSANLWPFTKSFQPRAFGLLVEILIFFSVFVWCSLFLFA